jgi:hypothetical protein
MRLILKRPTSDRANGPVRIRIKSGDAEHWITVHPNGEEPGRPLLIEGSGGSYTVKGGAGGKLNGTKVSPKSMSKPRGSSPPPEPTPHEKAQAASDRANRLSQTAKSAAEHYEAKKAHEEAMAHWKELGHRGNYTDHWLQANHHHSEFLKADKREKKQKARSEFEGSPEAKQIAEAEARFSKHTVPEIERHFQERYGMGFVNGSNAARDLAALKKEYDKNWRTWGPAEIDAYRKKASELNAAIRASPGGNVRGHTEHDISENTPQAKQARKVLGHIDEALKHLEAQGYDLKSAFARAPVSYTPGGTGKSLGHAWRKYLDMGRGYFTLSSAKTNTDKLLEQRLAHQRRAEQGKARWTVGGTDDNPYRTTAIHELAHAIGLHPGVNSPGKLAKLLEEHLGPRSIARHNWIRDNISEYATHNINETDAELAALVTHPDYVRGTLPKAFEDHVDQLFHKRPANGSGSDRS